MNILKGAANAVSNTTSNVAKGVGNAVTGTAKVVTDTTETVVQKTGVGKLAEKVGVHVDEDIHHNGLNTTIKVGEVKLESKVEVKTHADDYGAKGNAEVKKGDLTVAKAEGGVNNKGLYANAGAGRWVNSGFVEIPTIDHVMELIKKIVINPLVTEANRVAVGDKYLQVLEELLRSLYPKLTTLREFLPQVKQRFYLDVGASATLGLGVTAKRGMEQEVEIMDLKGKKGKQTFNMYELAGNIELVSLSAGMGYSKMGKTFDGSDEGALLVASGGILGISISIGLIITSDVSSAVGKKITDMKKEAEKAPLGKMLQHPFLIGIGV